MPLVFRSVINLVMTPEMVVRRTAGLRREAQVEVDRGRGNGRVMNRNRLGHFRREESSELVSTNNEGC